jgi:hypothetical protein
MWKRRFYLVMFPVGVLLIALLCLVVNREREPEYGGKRLSGWVLNLPPHRAQAGDTVSERAVRHIGTNALPYLLKWISYEPAPWRLKLYELAGKVLPRGPTNALFQDKNMQLAAGAAKAFVALGPEADAAMGEVNRIADDPKRGLSRVYLLYAHASQQMRNMNQPFSDCKVTLPSGADVFGLTFQTSGVPVLTVSHKTVPPVMRAPLKNPAVGSNAPVLPKAGKEID